MTVKFRDLRNIPSIPYFLTGCDTALGALADMFAGHVFLPGGEVLSDQAIDAHRPTHARFLGIEFVVNKSVAVGEIWLVPGNSGEVRWGEVMSAGRER